MATTSTITSETVEEWLDENPDSFNQYFLRKGKIKLVSEWIKSHRESLDEEEEEELRESLQESLQKERKSSPGGVERAEETPRKKRSGSRQFLRQDFAKARARTMFHTCVARMVSDSNQNEEFQSRSTKRGIRRASSLPATPGSMLKLLLQPKVKLPRRCSIDHRQKLELRSKNNRQLFFIELVKDVSNELDFGILREKISTNIGLLLDAERCMLFLKEGPKGREVLASVPEKSEARPGRSAPVSILSSIDYENRIILHMGEGVVGLVMDGDGNALNVSDVYKSNLGFSEREKETMGPDAKALLCLPVQNAEAETIGVALVVNKQSPHGTRFSSEDEKLLETYLTFCGISISNAELFENYMKEYDRNRALLEVVHDLFEEQTSLNNVVQKIMQRAQSLLKCERCSVLLIDDPSSEDIEFSKVFDLRAQKDVRCGQDDAEPEILSFRDLHEQVASTGETINIQGSFLPDLDNRENKSNGTEDSPEKIASSSVVIMPIRNNKFQIIGVAQIMNRTDGRPFDESDEQLFEAFTIFCGLGINNAILYANVCQAEARQSVSLDVLSYHANATQEDLEKLKKAVILPAEELKIYHLHFDDFSLDPDNMLAASIRMFEDYGLIQAFKIDYEIFCRWLLTVRKNYRNIPYHNFRHAFNVMQSMYAIIKNTKLTSILRDVEVLALLVGCVCHDLDHRGTNNAFQQKSHSPLIQLYGAKATMEYHHFNHAVNILNSQGHNIFSSLSAEEYSEVMNVLKQSILATDLAQYFRARNNFFELVAKEKCNWRDSKNKELLRAMLMTACDLAAATKPFEIQRKVANLVTSEFFDQGDKERKELHIEPPTMFDRRRKHELPQVQLDFIDLCLPLYQALVRVDSNLQPMLDGVLENREKWVKLNEQRLSREISSENLPSKNSTEAE